MQLNAKQLRTVKEKEANLHKKSRKTHPIYFILENIYDTYNIGGLFRLADAIGVEKIYLVGECEIPPNHKIKKASVGTYKVVPWEYKKTVKEALEMFTHPCLPLSRGDKKGCVKKVNIVAVEQHATAVNYAEAKYTFPLALIFGNETYGILPETLKLTDTIVEIPMWGINKSLNVIVSAAIVSYWIMNKVV